jgi:hypothetical protein
MTAPSLALELDLQAALALFLCLRDRRGEGNPDLEAIEASVRAYLYDRLSIAEMEEPVLLYDKLRAERDRRISRL